MQSSGREAAQMARTIDLIDSADLLREELERNPEFRERWERTALARAIAIAVIRYRSEHGLSQRALAKLLGMAYAQVARLELGEHNPTVDTLQRLAKGLGTRFILEVAPPDRADEVVLPAGVEVLTDVTLADGTRLLAAAG